MAENSEINISQSLMKELYDYRMNKACGLVLVEKYINKNFDLFKPSKVMELGNFFEYQAIGSTTKSNKIPKAEYLKDGKTLTQAYKNAETQVENFKNFMSFHGIKIVTVQEKWIVDGLEGTLDIKALATREIKDSDGNILIEKGEEFIIDLKFTSCISDKYSDFGWHLDRLSEKEKLILQPIHYKFLSRLKYGREYKFMFLLFSSANDWEYKSILFNTTEEDIELHKTFIASTARWLKKFLKEGFKAKPEYERCLDCPLKVNCKSFMAIPEITVFELNTNAVEK